MSLRNKNASGINRSAGNDGAFARKPSNESSADLIAPAAEGESRWKDADEANYEEDSRTVFAETFGGREFQIDLADPDDDTYTVYEDANQVASFTYTGDPEDHDSIWDQALDAMAHDEIILRCAVCGGELAGESTLKCEECALENWT